MAALRRTLRVRPASGFVSDPVLLMAPAPHTAVRFMDPDREYEVADNAIYRKMLRVGDLLPANEEARRVLRSIRPDAVAAPIPKPAEPNVSSEADQPKKRNASKDSDK